MSRRLHKIGEKIKDSRRDNPIKENIGEGFNTKMRAIFLFLIFLVLGVLFGLIFARVIFAIQNYFLRNKITKQALKGEDKFFYKLKPYDLKKEIETERSKIKKVSLFKKLNPLNLFKKSKKEVLNDYGHTEQPGVIGEVGGEPVFRSPENGSPEPTPTSPPSPAGEPGEQEHTDSTEDRGEPRRDFNSNLFKKGK